MNGELSYNIFWLAWAIGFMVFSGLWLNHYRKEKELDTINYIGITFHSFFFLLQLICAIGRASMIFNLVCS